MNIQDIKYIYEIMEEKSINKAATKLFTSQPSLSKCIKKVEQEYGITLFLRSKGSALILTEEGSLFREMAKSILQHHSLFEHQLEQLHSRNDHNIVFGAAIQRASDLAGPVMKWIYDHNYYYNLELHTYPSRNLLDELIAGNVEMVLITHPPEDPRLYATQIAQTNTYIYLRKGSTAGDRAYTVPGEKYKVLPLQEIENELIVANVAGTSSRRDLEALMKKAGVDFSITEQAVRSLRLAMVDAGYATMFTNNDVLSNTSSMDRSRVYALPEKQKNVIYTYLVCRKDFRHNKKYAILLEAFREFYKKSDIPAE